MRFLFPLWGIVAGYWLGSHLVDLITNDGLFNTTLSIIVGITFAILGAVFAYAYFAVAIILFMGVSGFWLGAGIIGLFGLDFGIVSAILGAVFAILFVAIGLLANAPRVYLFLVTSFSGAGLATAGVLLFIQLIELQDLENGAYAVLGDQSLFWKLVALTLAIAGLISQMSASQSSDIAWAKEWENQTKKAEAK